MVTTRGGDAAAVTGPADGGAPRLTRDWQLMQVRAAQVTLWTLIEGERPL